MPTAGAERWFHTLVVVGAALGGCGGKTNEQGPSLPTSEGGAASVAGANNANAGHPSSAASGGGPTSPKACDFDAELVCEEYATLLNCHCDVGRPHDAQACQSPFDFTCTELPCSAPSNQVCVGWRLVDCRCDPNALKPADCAAPEQFFCGQAYPPFRDCACRPGSPVDEGSCPDSYCCQSYDPRFGCDCSCVRIK